MTHPAWPRIAATLLAVGLVACGASKSPSDEAGPDDAPPPSRSAEVAPDGAAGDSGAAAGGDATAKPETKPDSGGERPPMEQLARDMIKTGRKIGWSASKRVFAYGMPWSAGPGRGMRVDFQAEDGKIETHEVCKPGECEQSMDDDMARELPAIAAKLGAGDFQPVWGNGWAPDQPELELRSAGLKLAFDKGRLSLVDGKSKKALGSAPGKSAPLAVFVVKDAKVLIVDFSPDGGASHEFKLFKLP